MQSKVKTKNQMDAEETAAVFIGCWVMAIGLFVLTMVMLGIAGAWWLFTH